MQKITPYFIAFIIVVCCRSTAVGQYYFYNDDYYETSLTWQAGVSAGGMNCLTDLGGKRGTQRKFINDINWNSTRPCGGLYAGANYKDLVGARLELAFGQVKASDDILKDGKTEDYGRYRRNLNFRSEIREVSLSVELYPYSIYKSYNKTQPRINPYILVGIGYFGFRPETFYNNTWVNVSSLHLEGQGFDEYPDRKTYRLSQFNMTAGIGFKFDASPVLNFHFEITYRKLWTDYLDDVSRDYIDPDLFKQYFSSPQAKLAARLSDRRLTNITGTGNDPREIRGNENNNDTYFSATIKIAIIMGRQKR